MTCVTKVVFWLNCQEYASEQILVQELIPSEIFDTHFQWQKHTYLFKKEISGLDKSQVHDLIQQGHMRMGTLEYN